MNPGILQSPTGNSAGQQAVKQDLESEHLNLYVGTKFKAPSSLEERQLRACFSGNLQKVTIF